MSHIQLAIVLSKVKQRSTYTNKYYITLALCNMEDKKVCKKIIKRAKKHPEWYTPEEVLYAKLMKKTIKKRKEETQDV